VSRRFQKSAYRTLTQSFKEKSKVCWGQTVKSLDVFELLNKRQIMDCEGSGPRD
jgi:hypothetical protein